MSTVRRYTILRPPESRRSIPERYRCSTDINEAIPEYCRCSSVARSGSALAENFKHVQKCLSSPAVANFVADVLPMSYRCPADVLPFLPMWYRCAAVPVPIPENLQICAPVLLRRAKSVRCDSALRANFYCSPFLGCSTYTLLVIKMEYFFLHNFMGYFLLWEIFRISRVFTTTMLSRPVSS